MGSRGFRIAALLVASVCAASADTIVNFTGVFSQDDNVQLFYFTATNGGTVTIQTTSFNSTDPTLGGFSPILTIFNADGTWRNEDSGFGGQTNAILTWGADPGAQYIVALTEYDNFSLGSGLGNLSDGWEEGGRGDFTGSSMYGFQPFNLPGGFYDGFLGPQTSGNWAVQFSGLDAVGLSATEVTSAVPEPSSWTLGSTVLFMIFGARILRRKTQRKGQEA